MKKCLIVYYLLTLINGYGQVIKCGDVLYKDYLYRKYPGLEDLAPRPENAGMARSNIVYKIPVVVHIVYNTNEENLSDAIVKNQIAILNKDYRRLNADAANTRPEFKPVAGDAMIEFELAQIDPDGKPTAGITKTKTSKKSFFDFDILLFLRAALECGVDFNDPASIEANQACLEAFFEKNGVNFENIYDSIDNVKYSDKGGIDSWNQKKYLNIWVCNLSVEIFGQTTPFLLGFAYPPVGAPLFPKESLPEGYEKNDGVVIHYQVFGKNNPAVGVLKDLNGEGRTCTHEVGHYLGLRHIWGDGDCSVDDGIADTPDAIDNSQPTDGTVPDCGKLHLNNTCTESTGPQLPDMIENYMDYSRESCMNMFTNGQINMMRSMLEGPRAELIGLQASTDDANADRFSVYPNPATNFIQFKNLKENAQITIYAFDGRFVKTFTSDNNGQCNVKHLKTGLYIARIEAKSGNSFYRFIKE
jgi:hypothetical protein